MYGLTRVRQFTISEAHLVIRPDQAEEELKRCFDLSYYVLDTLGLEEDVTYRLSKWNPKNKEKYLGDDNYWNRTQEALREVLRENGVDVTVDNRAEKIGYKIREAQMKKIPYMLVVGAKEEEDGLVSVRSRFEGDEGQKSLTDFLAAIKMEIQAKTAREVKKEDDK